MTFFQEVPITEVFELHQGTSQIQHFINFEFIVLHHMTSVKFVKNRNNILIAKLLFNSSSRAGPHFNDIKISLKFPIRFIFLSPFIILHRLVPLLDHDLFKLRIFW